MDPNQTPAPSTPGGYPPQTYPPQPNSVPTQDYPAPQTNPQPPGYPTPSAQPGYGPQQPPHTLRPAPAPASSWYTPPPKPDADKPADVSSYLQSAGVGPTPTSQAPTPTGGASGQLINGQYSIDYLDQMAAPAKQPIDKKFIFIVAGIGVALLVAAAMLIFSNQKATSTVNEVNLYTTMVDVESSTDKSSRYIKNSKLAAINSNMRTTLLNASRDMETPLTNMGQNPTTLKSAARNGTYNDEKFDEALEDARLNSTYDRIYANEVNTKMKYIIAYTESVKKSNSRKSIQEFISKNESSFKTIQKSIDDWISSPEANLY